MATKIRFERNPMMGLAHLLDEDSGFDRGQVYCSLPGGRPRFTFGAPFTSTVANAPQCDTFAEFKRFVSERFGD